MKEFTVHFDTTCTTTIEAETQDEAYDLAVEKYVGNEEKFKDLVKEWEHNMDIMVEEGE